jgi:hypothetical protein
MGHTATPLTIEKVAIRIRVSVNAKPNPIPAPISRRWDLDLFFGESGVKARSKNSTNMNSNFYSSSIIGKTKTESSYSEIRIPVRCQLLSKKPAKRNVAAPAKKPHIKRKNPIFGGNFPLKTPAKNKATNQVAKRTNATNKPSIT